MTPPERGQFAEWERTGGRGRPTRREAAPLGYLDGSTRQPFKVGNGVCHPGGFKILVGVKVRVAGVRPVTVAGRYVSDFDFLG